MRFFFCFCFTNQLIIWTSSLYSAGFWTRFSNRSLPPTHATYHTMFEIQGFSKAACDMSCHKCFPRKRNGTQPSSVLKSLGQQQVICSHKAVGKKLQEWVKWKYIVIGFSLVAFQQCKTLYGSVKAGPRLCTSMPLPQIMRGMMSMASAPGGSITHGRLVAEACKGREEKAST